MTNWLCPLAMQSAQWLLVDVQGNLLWVSFCLPSAGIRTTPCEVALFQQNNQNRQPQSCPSLSGQRPHSFQLGRKTNNTLLVATSKNRNAKGARRAATFRNPGPPRGARQHHGGARSSQAVQRKRGAWPREASLLAVSCRCG